MFIVKENMMFLTRSKSGLFCAEESGGGSTNTGKALIICGSKGEKLRPVFIPSSGHLANGTHAIIPVHPGCYTIAVDRHRANYTITVKRIAGIHEKMMQESHIPPAVPSEKESMSMRTVIWAEMEDVCKYSEGEWGGVVPEGIPDAIKAAMDKSMDYHCKVPYWVSTTSVGDPMQSLTAEGQSNGVN